MKSKPSDAYARIYRVVCRIPRGRVATYGQVASLAGLGGHARQVGYAMHAVPDDWVVPWQRVINAKGEVSLRAEPGLERLQQSILEDEGLVFDENARIDLGRYQWRPRAQRFERVRDKSRKRR